MREDSIDYGIRYTRGKFLNVVPVHQSEDERKFKFELFNNRVRARRPVATLTTSVGTVFLDGKMRQSFNANLRIRPDVPFSQEELSDLPADVATLMYRELGGNPLEEEFIVKITCPVHDDPNNKRDILISESWLSGLTDLNQYNVFSNCTLNESLGY